MISIHAIIGRVKHWWSRGAWGFGFCIIVGGLALLIYGMIYVIQKSNIEQAELRAERGIATPMNKRELSYSPSGVEYFIDCIEGREFLVSNPNSDRYAIAGPINDKEC